MWTSKSSKRNHSKTSKYHRKQNPAKSSLPILLEDWQLDKTKWNKDKLSTRKCTSTAEDVLVLGSRWQEVRHEINKNWKRNWPSLPEDGDFVFEGLQLGRCGVLDVQRFDGDRTVPVAAVHGPERTRTDTRSDQNLVGRDLPILYRFARRTDLVDTKRKLDVPHFLNRKCMIYLRILFIVSALNCSFIVSILYCNACISMALVPFYCSHRRCELEVSTVSEYSSDWLERYDCETVWWDCCPDWWHLLVRRRPAPFQLRPRCHPWNWSLIKGKTKNK